MAGSHAMKSHEAEPRAYWGNEDYLKEMGMQFQLERTRQRLSMKQVAEMSGIHEKIMTMIENGRESTKILTLKK